MNSEASEASDHGLF